MPTALVTGASAGIGDAFARLLARRGHDLVLVARDRARLEALRDDVVAAHGVAATVLAADLTDHDQLATVEARLASRDEPVDLLVNNAGFGTVGRFDQLPVDGEEREIGLNVVALVRLTHAAVRPMVERGRGGVINVSSLGGFTPTPGFATYGATKAFVTSFSHALHEELRGTGVVVTVVCPGFTRTEFQQRAGADAEASRLPGFLWMEAEPVAAAALDGNAKGRAQVVPGPINQATAVVTAPMPAFVTRRIAGLFSRTGG